MTQFVIFHKETTKFLRVSRNGCWCDATFETERAAKAGLTRAVKAGTATREAYAILPREEFNKIEKLEIRHGVGPALGKEYEVTVNAEYTAGPWSETYWSS